MKKLTLFTTLLLLTAILCGCAAATTGNTVPTDAPTTPTTAPTQPTEPQATEPPVVLEPLSFKGYHSGSFPGLKYKDEYGVVIRSVRELRAVKRADLTGKLAEYDDAFFEENSLIVIDCGHGSGIGRHVIKITGITELGENRYEVQVDHYDNNPLTWDMWEHGTFAEVNRVIEEDAEIAVKLRYFTSITDDYVWNMIKSGTDIDYTLPGEQVSYNVVKMDGDIGEFSIGTKYVRSVEDLEKVCNGNIPEQLSKYDESYFANASLYMVRKKNYMDFFNFPEISRMADGNYLIRAEYYHIGATMTEEEASKTTLYILEINEKFPEDVKPIWLQARTYEFDMAEGPKLQ